MNQVNIWMPMFVGDYLADTLRLSTEQHGAYLLMLMHYWRKGSLPVDDAELAQITRLDRARWKRHAPALRAYFREENGVLLHEGLDRERAKAVANREVACGRAKRAAQARWSRNKADAPGNAEAEPGQTPSPLPSPSPEAKASLESAANPSAAGSPASPPPKEAATQRNPEAWDPPEAPPLDPSLVDRAPLVSLRLNDGTLFHVWPELAARLQRDFPQVDVPQQLQRMRAWLEANPGQRKPSGGMLRFIDGWLGREQKEAPRQRPVAYLGAEDVL